jgi:hypothetical protein
MTKLTLVCASISIRPNQHTTQFVLPASSEAQKKQQPGQLAVKQVVQVSFSDNDHVKDFESGKQYEITITEVPAKKK